MIREQECSDLTFYRSLFPERLLKSRSLFPERYALFFLSDNYSFFSLKYLSLMLYFVGEFSPPLYSRNMNFLFSNSFSDLEIRLFEYPRSLCISRQGMEINRSGLFGQQQMSICSSIDFALAESSRYSLHLRVLKGFETCCSIRFFICVTFTR